MIPIHAERFCVAQFSNDLDGLAEMPVLPEVASRFQILLDGSVRKVGGKFIQEAGQQGEVCRGRPAQGRGLPHGAEQVEAARGGALGAGKNRGECPALGTDRGLRAGLALDYACSNGNCGACSVILDGVLVDSCLVLAVETAGSTVDTIESHVGPTSSSAGL